MNYTFKAKIWIYEGSSAWHFVTLPKKLSVEIKELFGQDRPGWGAVPVRVEVNGFLWKTSIFPDKKTGAYLLPLKVEARKTANLGDGDTANFKITILA